jgi:deoxycytidylate deaminase
MALKTSTIKIVEASKGKSPERIDDLQARRTPELVIAFVGPVGSGCTSAAKLVSKMLESKYSYEDVIYYRVSSVIEESAPLVGETYDPSLHGADRVRKLQDIGNKLREKFHADYLMAKIIEKVAVYRHDKGGYLKTEKEVLVTQPRRWAHIIDSIKNPAELAVLRDVYGEMLWVVGVFAPEETRKKRLSDDGWDANKISELFDRDAKQEWDYGQGVRDTFFQADFFVRNDGQNDEPLTRTLSRHLEVIFGTPVRTPTNEEAAMYAAYAAASMSACMSRQVGAAIVSQGREVIGIGWNDVPKFGGGLYGTEDGENDHRCFKWGSRICHNDDRKDRLYTEIYGGLKDLLRPGVSFDQAREVLSKTDVRQLIEYSRAVHAEMAALISVARGNKAGLHGSTLYCTTFPCHSCARHLVAAGIARVVYIEPYPKSLTLDLHHDSTSIRTADHRMLLDQYEGVSPRNLLRLFKSEPVARKKDGSLVDFSPGKADPLGSVSLDDFSTHEKRVLARLKEIENPEPS